MKEYMTISEFAALRNVNVNSIRYYEKLNILVPAWVDSKTGYRYYLPEQLVTLDMITLCIKLEIPLKELRRYIDREGKLDKKSILETGISAMQEKIAQMQRGVELTAYNLRSMQQNQEFCERKGVYSRELEERFLFEEPFQGNWDDLIQKEKMAIALFQRAQKLGMSPVFPAGILIHCDTEPVTYSFFVQVLHPAKGVRVIRVPQGRFSCLQIDRNAHEDVMDVLKRNMPTEKLKTVMITNLLLNNLPFNRRYSEIQIEQQQNVPACAAWTEAE